MIEILTLALTMLAAGAVAGVLAGLLGVGGGIVIVPVLYSALQLYGVDPEIRMQIAVATSLATIIPTSISSARSHHKKGAVDFPLVQRWALAIVPGALLGAYVGTLVKSATLILVFAIGATIVALWMLLGREDIRLKDGLPTSPLQGIIPYGIGFVSALMGIGGGSLTVPVLSLYAYPIHRAVGTSSLFGLLIAVPGALGFVIGGLGDPRLPAGSLGYVNLLGFAFIVPATILAAPLGARLAHRLSRPVLRKAFGVFLLITAMRFFWRLAH